MTHAAQIETATAEKIAEEIKTAEALITKARPNEAKIPNAAFWALVGARSIVRSMKELARVNHPDTRTLEKARLYNAEIVRMSAFWMN